jgi:hypothetical protein
MVTIFRLIYINSTNIPPPGLEGENPQRVVVPNGDDDNDNDDD